MKLNWELKYLALLEEKIFTNRNFWLYFTAILLLITLPINTPGSKLYLNNITVVKIRGDYFFHALTFIPWSFFMFAMNKRPWMWMFLGFLFSTGTELLQYLLPYRRFNINDLISNSLGILLGMVIFLLLTQGWKQRQTIT
jgi:glycopeptide antibiotics resistance protein